MRFRSGTNGKYLRDIWRIFGSLCVILVSRNKETISCTWNILTNENQNWLNMNCYQTNFLWTDHLLTRFNNHVIVQTKRFPVSGRPWNCPLDSYDDFKRYLTPLKFVVYVCSIKRILILNLFIPCNATFTIFKMCSYLIF